MHGLLDPSGSGELRFLFLGSISSYPLYSKSYNGGTTFTTSLSTAPAESSSLSLSDEVASRVKLKGVGGRTILRRVVGVVGPPKGIADGLTTRWSGKMERVGVDIL